MSTEFFSKLRNILTKNYFECISILKESLNGLIFKSQNNSYSLGNLIILNVEDSDKLDLIFLLIFNKVLLILKENLRNFKDFFLTELNIYLANLSTAGTTAVIDEKKKENIRINYSDEFNEIITIINTEIVKILQAIVFKNFKNCLNYSNLDLFLENYFTVFYIIRQPVENSSNFTNIINKIQTEFITNYYSAKNKKMRESVDCEDWQALKYVPGNYQKMVDFITKFNYMQLKDNDLNNIQEDAIIENYKIFENNSILLENEQPQIENDTGTILISNLDDTKCSFKMNISTLEIIKVIYDSLKLATLFERSAFNLIEQNLSKYLNDYICLMKKLILDGEALQKGRVQKLSQTEVSIANANASIIKNIIGNYIKNNNSPSSSNNNGKCIRTINPAIFDELLNNLDKIRHTCRYNISNLLNDSIRECISEFSVIVFDDYPISINDDKFLNKYVKIYIRLNSVYTAMVNTFDEAEIFNTFQENLKNFFDKLENCAKNLNEKRKITDSNQIKQYLNYLFFRFRKDLNAIKKNLKTFKILGKEDNNLILLFQERIELIIKLVVPKTSNRKK